MHSGQALTDEDRVPWLERIQSAVHQWRKTGKKIVFACSGLRRKYRLVLSEELQPAQLLAPSPDAGHRQSTVPAPSATAFSPFYPSPLYMFLLTAPRAVLMERIRARKGHYFPASLLQSQLDTLEPPQDDEDVMTVDVSMPKELVVELLVNSIMRRHRGGQIGEHVHAVVTPDTVQQAMKEPVLPNPFTSAL